MLRERVERLGRKETLRLNCKGSLVTKVISWSGVKSKTGHHITKIYSYLTIWALEVDFHDNEAVSAGH